MLIYVCSFFNIEIKNQLQVFQASCFDDKFILAGALTGVLAICISDHREMDFHV